jgi:hypothetical protein
MLFVLAGLLATWPQDPSLPGPQRGENELAAALERIGEMSSSRRSKLLARCVEAAEASGAPQVALVRVWADLPAKLPEPTEFGAHDAGFYKGGPPRRVIRPGRNLWDNLNAQVERRPADPRPHCERPVLYEFSTGELVRSDEGKDRSSKLSEPELGPEQPFRMLLSGILPDQALAEELLTKAFDAHGPMRKEAEFFAHLYCDREANAYEGLTLFDLWSEESLIEVPDPDTRAYAQLIWNDNSVPVPLDEEDHTKWYPRIEESLRDLRTYMFTTRAVAAVWFEGRPELTNGYGNSTDIMNACIALCEGKADIVAQKFEAFGPDFLTSIKAEIDSKGNETWNAGNARRDELAAGKDLIRTAVLAVLEEEKVF